MKKYGLLAVLFFAGCFFLDTYSITVEESGTKIITGTFDRQVLQDDTDFNSWYSFRYKEYSIDTTKLQTISSLSNGTTYLVILGTWCGDSKREVPHLLKILDSAKIQNGQIQLLGVDRSKKSEDGTSEKYVITHVPTIIVFKEGKELGRIVEVPAETLESDLVKILTKH